MDAYGEPEQETEAKTTKGGGIETDVMGDSVG